MASKGGDKCAVCSKTVYAMEKVVAKEHYICHKACFRCSSCTAVLTPALFFIVQDKLFCKNHKDDLLLPKGAAVGLSPTPTKQPSPHTAATTVTTAPSPTTKPPSTVVTTKAPIVVPPTKTPTAAATSYKAPTVASTSTPIGTSTSAPAVSSTTTPPIASVTSTNKTPIVGTSSPKSTRPVTVVTTPSKALAFTSTNTSPSKLPSVDSSSALRSTKQQQPVPAPVAISANPATQTAHTVPQAVTTAPLIAKPLLKMGLNPANEEDWQYPRSERREWKQLLEQADNTYNSPPSATESASVISSVLRGDMSVLSQLPPQQKGIRIFVSSTFTDTEKERNLLMQDVYPYLNTICKKLGLEFGTIDMRWGVREFTGDNHGTSELCMKELNKCLKASVGPAFICLLGDKYGYRPFPAKIERYELEAMWQHIIAAELPKLFDSHTDLYYKVQNTRLPDLWASLTPEMLSVAEGYDSFLIPKWFKLDVNLQPDLYILQNVSSILPDYITQDKEKKQVASGKWWATFEKMQQLLRKGSSALPNERDRRKYFIAVTHEEVTIGILDNPLRNNQCLCYLREIVGVENDPLDRNFIDTVMVDGKPGVMQDSRDLLFKLKDNELDVLSTKKVRKIQISREQAEIDAGAEGDALFYRRSLCDDLCRATANSILESFSKIPRTNHPLFTEASQHLLFQADKLANFVERHAVQDAVVQYLRGEMGPRFPLVLHARSGAGKTALVAWSAKAASEFPNAVVVSRYLGITPRSSEIVPLLQSLFLQLMEVYNIADTEGISEQSIMEELQDFFITLLRKISTKKQKSLYLFLDSLDQLMPTHNAHLLAWLPLELPTGVHVVVSTVSDSHEGVLGVLHNLYKARGGDLGRWFIEVPPLGRDEGEGILQVWLGGRTLTTDQMDAVLKGFMHCPTPLYLRVAHDLAVQWASYTPVSECFLGEDVKAIIATFFERLEKIHGHVLVKHALGYLTAARHGLSYADLEDVLSCDDQVLEEVYHFWVPPIRRLSPLLWSRLRDDIGPYLVERGVNDVTVYSWYHRQFTEVARARYLLPEDAVKRHALLASFFEGRFSSPTKITYRDRFGKEQSQDRLIVPQPLMYSGSIFNKHRLTELPYHQLHSMKSTLEEHLMSSLFNFNFVSAKIAAGMQFELMEDYTVGISLLTALSEDEEEEEKTFKDVLEKLKEFERFLNQHMHLLKKQPAQLIMFALNQPDRLSVTKHAVEQLQHTSQRVFVQINKPQPIDPCLRTFEGHSDEVTGCCFSQDGNLIVSSSKDKKLKVWDAITGMELGTVGSHEKKIDDCCSAANGVIASASWDKTLKIWDPRALVELRTLSGHSDMVYGCCFSPNSTQLVSASYDGTVRLWDVSTGNILKTFDFPEANCVSFSPDGKTIAAGAESGEVSMWFATGKLIRTFTGANNEISFICFSPDGGMMAVASMDRKVRIYETENGTEVAILTGHSSGVSGCCFSPDGTMIASASKDNTLKIWDPNSGEAIRTLAGHSSYVRRCCFSPNGKTLLSASDDKKMKLWDPFLAEITLSPGHTDEVSAFRFSPDGTKLVSASWDSSLKLWDPSKGQELVPLKGHTKDVNSCCFSVDGTKVVSAGRDKTLKVWDSTSGDLLHTLVGHTDQIQDCCCSPDGKFLVSGAHDETVRIWDTSTWLTVQTLTGHSDIIMAVCFSPDSSLFVSASFDRTMKVWDTKTWQELRSLTGHTKRVDWCCFSPDGQVLVSVSQDKSMKVWDPFTGKELTTRWKHSEMVKAIFFVGNQLYSYAANELFVWDPVTWLVVESYYMRHDISALAVHDNKYMVYGTSEGECVFFEVK